MSEIMTIKKVVIIIWTSFTPMLPEIIELPESRSPGDFGDYYNFNVREEYEYSATIVFDSIRLAFPNSDIKVVMAGNICVTDKLRSIILQKIEDIGGKLIEIEAEYSQGDILRNIIFALSHSEEPLAIVDSDIIFWDRFDNVSDALYEGYFIPSYEECYSTYPEEEKVLVHPNVHAAFLKIKSPKLLCEKISEIEGKYPELDLFTQTVISRKGKLEHYDTMSMLYSVVSDNVYKYGRDELSKFVHLYGGNQLDYYTYMKVENNPRSLEFSKLYGKIHTHVKNKEYDQLRDLWSWYKEYKFDLLE
jgi:hypothetical protein